MLSALKPTRFAAKADIRFVGAVLGRYTFPDDLEHAVYTCRTLSLSPVRMVVEAPVKGRPGLSVTMKLEHIGRVSGRIDDLTAAGFRLDVSGTDLDKTNLAARINWLKKHSLHQVEDKRADGRFRPRNASVMLEIEGERLAGLIIDLSGSGAALSASVSPPVGAGLKVGAVAGKVVRLFEGGFGVQFDAPHPPAEIEKAIAAELAAPSRKMNGAPAGAPSGQASIGTGGGAASCRAPPCPCCACGPRALSAQISSATAT